MDHKQKESYCLSILDNSIIKQTTNSKYLGVTIDEMEGAHP